MDIRCKQLKYDLNRYYDDETIRRASLFLKAEAASWFRWEEQYRCYRWVLASPKWFRGRALAVASTYYNEFRDHGRSEYELVVFDQEPVFYREMAPFQPTFLVEAVFVHLESAMYRNWENWLKEQIV